MATLKERIDADLKDAMRSKNELSLSVLRMLKSAVKYKEVEPGASALDDEAVQKVINTLIKQRRESVDQFKSGGRPELAEKEEQEIAVLQKYLPQQLSAEELSALVTAAISESGAQGPKDMGAVMKNVNPKIQGRAEGRAVSDEVKSQLSKMS
ncbi:GatB/YqeY domain-containing protein [Corallococcus sp. ZKHCc1 1396]|uniref:GatB/YqeY domain-containing protein n=1 Tax=Corallococcus soli TaxID=2710757 RepID=A0ABR9PL06_9BACT|nr:MULTISPECIES: GatB/YqeY domain-containing protein [Corallococcus]MBE4748540.1 GatB/YqeY domain-containing protein [Corallococcus soli]MCY1032711.1 GatB/YqeY domain-containing protein [Corallococcus sp. BB11-1]